MCVGCIASSLDDVFLQGCLWWDSHGVRILSFLVGHTWSPDFVISFSVVESTVGKGLVHLVLCLVERLIGCVTTWGGETDRLSSCPPATSASAVTSLEEEGLHARPLPHILGVYINFVAVFFGGGRIGTSPFLLTMSRCSLEEEGEALLLTNPASSSEGEGQALFLTMSVRSVTACWLCSAGCSWARSSWVVDCWDASTIPSVWVGIRFAHGCRSGPFRDALQHHALWDCLPLAHGYRTVPLGTLCDTMWWACRLLMGKIGWAAN